MASPSLPSSSSSDPTTEGLSPSETRPAPRRQVLGEPPASSTRSSRSVRAPSVSEDVFSAPAPTRPNGRMPVFVDPSGDVENDPNHASGPSPWPELGTRKTRVKENTMEVSKAAGTRLRGAGRSTRAPSGSSIAVFRDPGPDDAGTSEMPPPPVPPARKEKTRTASKSSIPVFRDDEAEAAPSAPSNTVAKKGKTRSASKSSIAVFRDEDEPTEPAVPVVKKGKARTASKGSITVFRDEDEPTMTSPPVPATPKFVPFRDDEVRI